MYVPSSADLDPFQSSERVRAAVQWLRTAPAEALGEFIRRSDSLHRPRMATQVADQAGNWDADLGREVARAQGHLESLAANPHTSPEVVEAALEEALKLGRHADSILPLFTVAVRRRVLRPTPELAEQLIRVAKRSIREDTSYALSSGEAPYIRGTPGHALLTWAKELRGFFQARATGEEALILLWSRYVRLHENHHPVHGDPAGCTVARHPRTRPEDLVRLLEEYPNVSLVETMAATSGPHHRYTRHPVLRAHLRAHLHEQYSAHALALDPQEEDFREAMEALRARPREWWRVVESAELDPRWLLLLEPLVLTGLLSSSRPEARLKAIRALGLEHESATASLRQSAPSRVPGR